MFLQSPAKESKHGIAPSESIPIPKGNNSRMRLLSDSDDQVPNQSFIHLSHKYATYLNYSYLIPQIL